MMMMRVTVAVMVAKEHDETNLTMVILVMMATKESNGFEHVCREG